MFGLRVSVARTATVKLPMDGFMASLKANIWYYQTDLRLELNSYY